MESRGIQERKAEAKNEAKDRGSRVGLERGVMDRLGSGAGSKPRECKIGKISGAGLKSRKCERRGH